jgi:hypothetical protein
VKENMSNIYIRPARASEIHEITSLRIEAFGDNGLIKALFPDETRRATDFPAWRMMYAVETFSDLGRHHIVAVERREDGSEEIVGTAEWISPGGPDPEASAEELAEKNAKRRVNWPKSIKVEAIIAVEKVTNDAISSGMLKAGLPENAEKDMWGE